MTRKLAVWCFLSALLVLGSSAQLVAAHLSRVERDASASFACGTCMVQRIHRVRTASHLLEAGVASAAVSLAFAHRRLRPGWRCGYLGVCAIGATKLAVYFTHMS